MDSLKLDQNEKEMLEHIIQQMEKSEDLTEQRQLPTCVLISLKESVMKLS